MIANITTPQMRYIYKLLRDLSIEDAKETLIESISDGRTTSMKELTHAEARRLIKNLSAGIKSNDPRLKMQRSILSMAHQMGCTLADNPAKVDMAAVNAWCVKHGYLHKPMDDYTMAELPKLVQQYRRMFINKMKSK